jgi:hypothetical protein
VEDALSEGIDPSELVSEPVRAETAARVHKALGRARVVRRLPAAAR